MRIAKVENGIVVQVIIVNTPEEVPEGWLDGTNANVGWRYENGKFTTPERPVVVFIPDLTFAQLLIGLVSEGWISQVEGEAWLDGQLPPIVQTLIDGMPEGQRFVALARAKRPSTIVRDDPLVVALGALKGISAEQLDNFFKTYSQL